MVARHCHGIIPFGIEAGQCYYFDPDKLAASDRAAASDSNDVADYPNPDLAVEIDLPSSLTGLAFMPRSRCSRSGGSTAGWRL